MWPLTRALGLRKLDPIVMNIPGFNLLPATGTPVSVARAGWVHVAIFVVGECAAFSRLLFGVSERIKIMIFFILYALGTFAFVCWILGWSLWHAYLAFSRFFKIHNHKRRT
jgi:hypothetical protein